MNRIALLISTAATALLAAASVHAQTAVTTPTAGTAEAGSSEEIIVTAQKRAQNLIDVPQSVSVVTGATLERQQAISFQDYVKLIPGLTLSQSNPGEARLVLRGVNTGGVAATVATYVDETPFGSSSGQVNAAILAGEFDTFDIARVEVLRGPQGTLYGASSLSGVLKFVTEEPRTDKFEARGCFSIEGADSGQASYMGSGLVNVPLSGNLAVRGSGFYRKYGGFIDSIGTGGSDVEKNINDSKSYGGRISTLFKPSTTFSLRLTAILQNLDSDAASVVESGSSTLDTLDGQLSQSQFVPEFTDISYRLYNGTANVDLGFADLTSSTSYSTLKESLRDDLTVLYGSLLGLYDATTGTAAADIGLRQHTNVTRFTQEVRLASHANKRFDWLLGGYYTHEKGAILQRLDVFNHGSLDAFPNFPLLADIFARSKYEEYAAFANGTLHFGPRFDLTLGGRYSHNDQTADQGGTGALAPPALSAPSNENVFTWSVAPKFKFSTNSALYVRVAKGFRPGGPNIIPPAAPADTPSTYGSDSLISYEAGVKTETSDHKFSIDLAAFHIDWKDIQLFALVNGFGINANGGKAKSDGFEFTATARPTMGLNLSVNGAYTHARLTTDTDLNFVGGRAGDALPFSPRYSVGLNGDYEWDVGGTARGFVGGSLRYLGEESAEYSPSFLAANGRQRELNSYTVVDLRAGVDFGRFSIEAYTKNLTNSHGRTSVEGEGNYPNGAIGTGIIRPRTIGLTLGFGL